MIGYYPLLPLQAREVSDRINLLNVLQNEYSVIHKKFPTAFLNSFFFFFPFWFQYILCSYHLQRRNSSCTYRNTILSLLRPQDHGVRDPEGREEGKNQDHNREFQGSMLCLPQTSP